MRTFTVKSALGRSGLRNWSECTTVVVLETVTVQGHFQKKVKNLQMEADRLELIARRHKLAPSSWPSLLARPMRVQIVLGARLYPAWFTHGRWPVPFRAAGLRGRRNRR